MMSEIEKYIQEIFGLIFKKDELDQITFDLSIFLDHIGYNSIVKEGNDEMEKRKILVTSQLGNIESKILREYFENLVNKDDLWVFEPGHFKTFVEEINEIASKTIFFNLTTAVDVKNEDLKLLADKLSKKMEQKVVVHLTIDKNIIGGAIIKKGNFILDFSLKTKMNNLTSQWKKSIQKEG